MRKHFSRSSKHVGIVLLVTGLFLFTTILSGFFFLHLHQKADPFAVQIQHIASLNASDVLSYFKSVTEQKGSAYAFALLRSLPPASNINDHTIGHVIGSVIYKQKGVEGLKDCTTEFTYSCYHSVLADAIADHGLAIVDELNRVCKSSADFFSCQHGIGHGVLASTGYSDFRPALAICQKLSVQGSITGCLLGVFMEYNSLTMLDVTGQTQRPMDDRGLQYPCDTVTGLPQTVCYYEQPVWWHGLPDFEGYQKIGSMCDALSDPTNKAWCFRRIGSLELDSPGGTASSAKSACSEASADEMNKAYCLQMLNYRLPNDQMCGNLTDPSAKAQCEASIIIP